MQSSERSNDNGVRRYSVENVATFEHFNLGVDIHSSVKLINHRFAEDTVIENLYPPGLYISMLGWCQCDTMRDGLEQLRNFDHQYVIAVVDKTSSSQIRFAENSFWQTFAIMLPLNKLNECSIPPASGPHATDAIPHIRLTELGPIPVDILRCCEAVWDCRFKGFERELFIKAKAQEVLALFLHKRREQRRLPANARRVQLENALSHIQTHLAEDWSLSAVAQMAGSNRTYVKQDIKELIGLSFRDWLKAARLDAARERLSGNKSITQIAHDVGFKSHAHFATLFKSEMGVTPSEYRRSLLMQHNAQGISELSVSKRNMSQPER